MTVPLHCANGVVPPSGQVKSFGAVVGGEDDDGVVVLAHVLELLQDEADVVVELGHAGFLHPTSRSPSCASLLVLLGEVRDDVHARRVEPDRRTACRPSWPCR